VSTLLIFVVAIFTTIQNALDCGSDFLEQAAKKIGGNPERFENKSVKRNEWCQ
jgi:hypothetical protein